MQYYNQAGGISLLELIFSMSIAGILLVATGAIVTSSTKIINGYYNYNLKDHQHQVAMNLLTSELLINIGDLNVISSSNNEILSFKIPSINNPTINTVNYICNYNTQQFYRQMNNDPPDLLIDQVNACSFSSNLFGDHPINLTITIAIYFMPTANIEHNIYRVINVPYQH